MPMSREKKTAWQRADRKKSPKKYKKAQGRWRKENEEKRLDYQRKYYKTPNGKRSYLAYSLKKDFGITLEEYETMLEKQNNACAICKQPETMKARGVTVRLSVDHCHTTMKVRGLLCRACNVLLGNSRENLSTLQAAIEYLRLNRSH